MFIAQVSAVFDVSIQAATNRLKDLGYIKTNDTTDYSYASAIMDFAGVVGSWASISKTTAGFTARCVFLQQALASLLTR